MKSILVSETYSIEDCIFYDPCTSNAKASAWTIPSGVTSTYSSEGWNVSANAYKQIKLTEKLTSACSVEFTLTDFSNTSDMAVIIFAYTNGETTPNKKILSGGTTLSSNRVVFNSSIGHEIVKNVPYRIEYGSSTMKVYEDGTQIGSATNNIGFPTRFEFHTGSNRWAIYKDIKVKPL